MAKTTSQQTVSKIPRQKTTKGDAFPDASHRHSSRRDTGLSGSREGKMEAKSRQNQAKKATASPSPQARRGKGLGTN
jgi:hypothetical protein